jgi:asparaginyl-tRNA synthetase
MNSQLLAPGRKYGDLLDSVNTVMGRIMNMETREDHVRTWIRSNGNNLEIDIPRALIDATDVTVQSIVKLVLSTDSDDAPVAKDLQVVRMAQPMPVALEDIEATDLKRRHLYIRSNKMLATARFRHFVNKYAREYLDEQGCINVQTPILTEASCVCSGDVFAFPYYGKTIANLIQSPWMYADAMSSAFDRVYTLNPSFRREKEASSTHLVEIWQMQVDVTWSSNDDVMTMEEELVKYIASRLKARHLELYELGGLSYSHLDDILKPFEKVSYKDTVDIINANGLNMKYGTDYTDQQQDLLARQFDRPFFITDFPQKIKNFWFPVHEDNPELTPSNDLFAHTGHGEIIGGGERVSDAEQLRKNLKYFHHDEDEFDWFLEIRKYGCVPHAGFSIGFDRLVAFMMGVNDIIEASVFPRIPYGPIKP